MTARITTTEVSGAQPSVRRWRVDQFAALGFSELEAELLAVKPEADLARARTLVEAGCPSELAIRLLA